MATHVCFLAAGFYTMKSHWRLIVTASIRYASDEVSGKLPENTLFWQQDL